MKHVNLRIDDDLHARCVAHAKADGRSLNSWILRHLERLIYVLDPSSYDPAPTWEFKHMQPGVDQVIAELNSEIDALAARNDGDGKSPEPSFANPVPEEKLHG